MASDNCDAISSEQRAESQALDLEDWIEDRNYRWDIDEVKTDGVSVEARMSGDEEDFSTRWIGTDRVSTPPVPSTATPEPESRDTTGTRTTSRAAPTERPSRGTTPAPTATLSPSVSVTAAPWPTPTPVTPRATSLPGTQPTLAPTTTAVPALSNLPANLVEYALRAAGGPGAVYVGDLTHLVGPAPGDVLSDQYEEVSLDALERHRWIYESDYYESLLDRASLTNPTQMTYDGQAFMLQLTCVDRALFSCRLLENYLVPNLEARTDGRFGLEVVSLSEIGVAGDDVMELIRQGALSMATVYGGYAAWSLPQFDIQNLWGIHASPEQEFETSQAIAGDIDRLTEAATGGSAAMSRSWYAGSDLYLFCREPLSTPDDFRGRKIRSQGAAISDWVEGMGAEAQSLPYAEVYTALERRVLDCAITDANTAYWQRWYEVVRYMAGPLYHFPFHNNVVNRDVWQVIPADLQQILLEEAAKTELEALRLAAARNEIWLHRHIDAGMDFTPFSDEVRRHSLEAAISSVIPNWIERVGSSRDPIVSNTFNNRVGPIVGLHVPGGGLVVRTN